MNSASSPARRRAETSPTTPSTPQHTLAASIPTVTLLHVASDTVPIGTPEASIPARRPVIVAPPITSPVPRTRTGRKRTVLASVMALGLGLGLLAGLPAQATPTSPASSATTASLRPDHAQSLRVSSAVSMPATGTDLEATTAVAPVAPPAGVIGTPMASGVLTALQVGGERQIVVRTALSYLGVPYQLGGDTMAGIDCSGLVFRAYESIGRPLGRLVHLQDEAGTRIDEAQARPGDLVVFDDHEHIAIYLGNGLLVAAPSEGRDVEIQTTQSWSGIPHHFTTLLGP